MVEVRTLTARDRADWLQLRIALWPREDASAFDQEVSDILATPETMAAFGAEADGRLIGFAETAERAWGDGCETTPVAWLEGIYVVPEFRRHGVARSLVAAVRAWATARGYRELGSDVHIDNDESLAGHASWGFEETKRIVNFRIRL